MLRSLCSCKCASRQNSPGPTRDDLEGGDFCQIRAFIAEV